MFPCHSKLVCHKQDLIEKSALKYAIINTGGSAVEPCNSIGINVSLVHLSSVSWCVTEKLIENWFIGVLNGVMEKKLVCFVIKFLRLRGKLAKQIHDEMFVS